MKRVCICFFALFLLGYSSIHAQIAPHEFTVFAGGGFATNFFQPSSEHISSIGFSSDFGLGFTGFVSQQLGFQIGAGFGLFNVKTKLSTFTLPWKTLGRDENGLERELNTNLSGYSEIHKTLYLCIPALVQFQTKMRQSWDWTRSQKTGFYAMGGVKVLFLVSNRYEASIAQLQNSAYYPSLKNWAATQEFAGLGFFDINSITKEKLDFGVMALVTLEMGMKWRLNKTTFLYAGAYYDCGLNDPTKNVRQSRDQYTNHKQLIDNIPMLKLGDKVNYMAAGVKFRIAFTYEQ